MIIAALMGTFYGYNAGKDDVVKKRQTLAKMEIIEKALAQYLAENDRLPCPAYTASWGGGLGYCSGVLSKQAASPAGLAGTSTWVSAGLVPYTELKIPKGIVIDGYGNYFTYVVNNGLAGLGSNLGPPYSTPYSFESSNMGVIIINDPTGAQITNQAVYVLISHGSNGLGSWNSDKTSASVSFSSNFDPNEAENAEHATSVGSAGWNTTFVASELYYSTIGTTTNGPAAATNYTTTTSYFDDIVHWKTKWQIIREAGSLLSNSTCTLAYTVLTKQDNTFNTLYYNYYCNGTSNKPANAMCSFILNSLATKVNDLCLNKVS